MAGIGTDIGLIQAFGSSLKSAISGKMTIPETAGTSGQVLVSDGNGGQVWGDIESGEVVIDPSLSVAGAAADAGSVGTVKSALSIVQDASNGWVLGSLKTDTGAEQSSTTRIRSPYIYVVGGEMLTLTGNEKCMSVYCYTKDSIFTNAYDSSKVPSWDINNRFVVPADVFFVRVLIRKSTGNETISSDEVATQASRLTIYKAITGHAYDNLANDLINGSRDYVGKNLFNFKPRTETINGVTFTVKKDGSVVANGTASDRAVFLLYDENYRPLTDYGLKSGVRYTLTGCPSGGGGSSYYLTFQALATTNLNDRGLDRGIIIDPATFATDKYRPVIDIKKNYSCNNLTFYPMVSEYSVYLSNNTYEPHYYSNKEISTILAPEKVFRSYVPILDGQHIMAHKGGNFGAPLNTMSGFKLGFEKGYCVLEADIQVTSDDVPVICHNTSINSVAKNADGTDISSTVYVYNTEYDDLLDYDFGIQYGAEYAGEKIATLDQFLMFCKRANIVAYIDLDSTYNLSDNIETIYNAVKKARMLDNVIFDCNNVTDAGLLIDLDTNLNILVQGATSTENVDAIAELLPSCKRLIANIGNSSYSPSIWAKEFVEYIHSKGLYGKVTKTNVTKAEAIELFELGTDFIMADDLIPYELIP